MIMRDARPGDRPTLVAFMAALQEFERGMEPNRTPGAEMADSHLAALEAWAAEHPGGGVLVAEDDGRLVGFAVAGASTDRGTYLPTETRTVGWISDLWVESEFRGGGIARALVTAVEARFRAAGIRRVEIAAVAGNARALGVYESLGFSRYEITLAKPL
jgi:GNAT superfamily N-acetyltransferase